LFAANALVVLLIVFSIEASVDHPVAGAATLAQRCRGHRDAGHMS